MSERVTPNPTGLCMCGCGEMTPISRWSRPREGTVKGEHIRYIHGHFPRTQKIALDKPNPSGFCMCGCLERVPRARKTERATGLVKGEFVRYLPSHQLHRKGVYVATDPGPNPSGMCMCGCGERAPIARSSNKSRGEVKGTPQRYLKAHNKRGKATAPAGKRLAILEAARARDTQMVALYREGLKLDEIASRLGVTRGVVGSALHAWRRNVDPTLPRRKAHSQRRLTERLVREGRISQKTARKLGPGVLRGLTADAIRDAELTALSAEQEHDDEHGDWVDSYNTVSLDAPFGEGGSLHDVLRAGR